MQITGHLIAKKNIKNKNVLHQQNRTHHLCYLCIALSSPVLQFNSPPPPKKMQLGSNSSSIMQKKNLITKLKIFKNFTIVVHNKK